MTAATSSNEVRSSNATDSPGGRLPDTYEQAANQAIVRTLRLDTGTPLTVTDTLRTAAGHRLIGSRWLKDPPAPAMRGHVGMRSPEVRDSVATV